MHKTIVCLAAALAAAAQVCLAVYDAETGAAGGGHARIAGGASVPNGLSYAVHIRPIRTLGGQVVELPVCSGVVIQGTDPAVATTTRAWILTSATCARSGTAFRIYVGRARVLPNTPPDYYPLDAAQAVIHPDNLADPLAADLALIPDALDVIKSHSENTNTTASRVVTYARLPTLADAQNSYIGTAVFMAGWGLPRSDFEYASPVAQGLASKVVRNKDCTRASLPVTARHLCTQAAKNKGVCLGDSGAPLVIQSSFLGASDTVIGLGTLAPGSGCRTGGPSAFTNLADYLDWIAFETNNQAAYGGPPGPRRQLDPKNRRHDDQDSRQPRRAGPRGPGQRRLLQHGGRPGRQPAHGGRLDGGRRGHLQLPGGDPAAAQAGGPGRGAARVLRHRHPRHGQRRVHHRRGLDPHLGHLRPVGILVPHLRGHEPGAVQHPGRLLPARRQPGHRAPRVPADLPLRRRGPHSGRDGRHPEPHRRHQHHQLEDGDGSDAAHPQRRQQGLPGRQRVHGRLGVPVRQLRRRLAPPPPALLQGGAQPDLLARPRRPAHHRQPHLHRRALQQGPLHRRLRRAPRRDRRRQQDRHRAGHADARQRLQQEQARDLHPCGQLPRLDHQVHQLRGQLGRTSTSWPLPSAQSM